MKLLTMKEVCARVGFGRTHVNRFRNDEDYTHVGFPRPAVVGIKLLWDEDEINAWIRAQLDKRKLP